MAVLALLVVSLGLIVVGAITGLGPWFLGSVVVSLVAAYQLWHSREAQSSGPLPDNIGERLAAGQPVPGLTGAEARVSAWVVDGRPAFHRAACPTIGDAEVESVPLVQALADGFTACPECDSGALLPSRN